MTNYEQAVLFGENLKKQITKTGKQQKDIAIELDIPITTLNNWCVGKVMPRYGKLQKLAEYFGCTISDLTEAEHDSSEDIQEALELYKDYKNALPQVQEIVLNLLRSSRSDS